MNKKLISILTSSILAGSLMVGCSSSNTSNEKEEKYTTQSLSD